VGVKVLLVTMVAAVHLLAEQVQRPLSQDQLFTTQVVEQVVELTLGTLPVVLAAAVLYRLALGPQILVAAVLG